MAEIALTEDYADLPPITEHQSVEFVCVPGDAALAFAIDGQELEPFLRPGEAIWRWRWNPGAAAGLHRLLLTRRAAGEETRQEWALRVLARKIDQDTYQALIDDVQRVAYRLVAALAGAGAEGAELVRGVPWRHSPAEEFYALFEARLDSFARAVRRIGARPREHLRGGREAIPLGQADQISAGAIAGLARAEFEPAPPEAAADLQAALRPGGGVLPRELPAERARPTTDIYEHRLLKHLLTLLLRHARTTGQLATREAARLVASEAYTNTPSTRRLRAEQIAAGCAAAEITLRELRALPFLASVAPLPAFRGATPLLQRDPAYREVYAMWQALRQQPQLAFDSPLFAAPIAELPRLYESWCALQVAEALLALGGDVREQHLIETRQRSADDALEQVVALSERAPLLVIARGETTLTLRYQPRYRPPTTDHRSPTTAAKQRLPVGLGSLDHATHVPDLAIEVRRADTLPQVLLLDAKYRLEANGHSLPPDAFGDAYTYLGAIGCGGRRTTLGALLLYPAPVPAERFSSGIGTVPLLPGRTSVLNDEIVYWIGHSV